MVTKRTKKDNGFEMKPRDWSEVEFTGNNIFVRDQKGKKGKWIEMKFPKDNYCSKCGSKLT